MALSIKTEEADRLARELAALTGETMTETVTRALRERLDRLQAERRASQSGIAASLLQVAEEIRENFDLKPISKAEWDALWGEDEIEDLSKR
jgi:antitoxin VapB